jgi:hypothetical protein
VSREELLGRARRAVLAVAGTAGALGGRVRRGQDEAPGPSGPDEARPRPAPTPGLPPRIGREPAPGLPPRIERDPVAPAQPPRIEREPVPELPPRIRREPAPGPPSPWPEAPATPAPKDDTVYLPRHARPAPDAPPPPPPPPPPEPDAGPDIEREEAAEPAPVSAPPAGPASPPPGPRPAPAATWRPPSATATVRDALRPHARFLIVVLVALFAVGAVYFTLRVHQRISESSLEHRIAQRDDPQNVRCSELQSNGSAWACAVAFRAEAECLIARVNVFGSWSTVARPRRCAKISSLVELLPERITAAGVAADVGQQLGVSGLTCRKVPEHEVRWACGLPPAPGGQCVVVRQVQWETWPAQDGGRLCDHFPALETAIRASQGQG